MNNTRTKVLICIFLMVATFCIYSQVQDHEFINYDDNEYVTESSLVQSGLTTESIIRVFTTVHFGGWIPLSMLSFILDYEIYGLNPTGYLLTNLFFHIANSLLLFLVLFRMTGTIWQSAFVAAMFAFHPLNVESVAWIVERKNVLSTLFWLLTMWAYIRYADKPTVKKYGLVFLFFTLGLMSKPMLVTLPFVLLLLDYWPLRRLRFREERDSNEVSEKKTAQKSEIFRLVLEKVPLFLLAMGSSILTLLWSKREFGTYSLDLLSLQAHTNAMVSYLEYLRKMLWPSGLSILYPHPGNALPLWQGILCGMVLMGITVVSIRLIRKAPYVAVGWFWYLGTLVPVIGIVQVAMADHYTYIPLIGIFIIVAWGVPELISKWRYKKNVLSVSAGIIISILLITTWWQVSHWKNSITIFNHAIRVTDKKYPNFAVIYNNLGNTLFADRKIEEAIYHLKMAIKLSPNYIKAHNNLGIALFSDQKNEEAISHFKMAIKLSPNHTQAHHNLGIALFANRKIEEAIFHYKTAIKLRPNYTKAHFELGYTLFANRKIEEAISHYKMAIKLNPKYTKAHYNLGNALLQKGEVKEAVHHFRETLKLRPDFAAARDHLELALLQSQELE